MMTYYEQEAFSAIVCITMEKNKSKALFHDVFQNVLMSLITSVIILPGLMLLKFVNKQSTF